MKQLIYLLILFLSFNVNVKGQFKSMGTDINSKYHELRPVVTQDGKTIYFTVEGNPKNPHRDGQDIWTSTRDENGEWTKAARLSDHINKQRYNGVYWVSPFGNKLLIRGSYNKNGTVSRGFSIVNKIGGTWTDPTPLVINGYNNLSRGIYTGATLSPDEKALIMYFSDEKNSDINDLWLSLKDDSTGEYSTPVKLDLSSDDDDEISPYISPDGKTLFYSSDMKGGLGGHDIWVSKRLDDTWLNWSIPVNAGSAINTSDWDAYFSIGDDGVIGYVTRNHKYDMPTKMGGADLYSFVLPESLKPEKLFEPVLDDKNTYVHDTLLVRDTLFVYDTVTITLYKNIPCNPLDTMSNEQLSEEIISTKILFDFGSSVLRSDSYKKLDIILAMMRNNPDLKIELGGHTDAVGNDKGNFKKSEERAISARNYIIGHGINKNRVVAKGYSNTKPISDNKTDAGRQLNRRVDVKVIN